MTPPATIRLVAGETDPDVLAGIIARITNAAKKGGADAEDILAMISVMQRMRGWLQLESAVGPMLRDIENLPSVTLCEPAGREVISRDSVIARIKDAI